MLETSNSDESLINTSCQNSELTFGNWKVKSLSRSQIIKLRLCKNLGRSALQLLNQSTELSVYPERNMFSKLDGNYLYAVYHMLSL